MKTMISSFVTIFILAVIMLFPVALWAIWTPEDCMNYGLFDSLFMTSIILIIFSGFGCGICIALQKEKHKKHKKK